MPKVTLPDGRVVHFPYTMSNEEIQAAVQRMTTGGSVDFSAREMASNIPASAKQYGKDLLSAVTNPIDTAKTLGGIAGGGLEKLGRKFEEFVLGEEIPADPGEEELFNAAVDMMKDRYGSMDKIKQTAMYDPVGFLADFATLAAPAASAPGRVGQVGKVAQMGDLGNLATKGLRTAGKAIPEGAAAGVYNRALKLGTTKKDRDRILNTLVRERIKPTKSGMRKHEAMLRQAEDQLGMIVRDATERGEMIPRELLYQHVDQLFDDLGGVKAEGLRDQAKVVDVVGEVMENIGDKRLLTPDEVQAFKVDLYDKIYQRKISPEPKKRSGAKTEAQSAVARGARNALEDVTPEAADVNRLLGDLYVSRAPLAQGAARISNMNVIPTRALFGGAAGGWKGALASALVDHPRLKARLAFAIDALKRGDIMQAERGLTSNEIRTAMRLSEMTEEELRELGLME